MRAKVETPTAAGLTAMREDRYGDEAVPIVSGHVVMHDPEGNEVCVCTPSLRPGEADEAGRVERL